LLWTGNRSLVNSQPSASNKIVSNLDPSPWRVTLLGTLTQTHSSRNHQVLILIIIIVGTGKVVFASGGYFGQSSPSPCQSWWIYEREIAAWIDNRGQFFPTHLSASRAPHLSSFIAQNIILPSDPRARRSTSPFSYHFLRTHPANVHLTPLVLSHGQEELPGLDTGRGKQASIMGGSPSGSKVVGESH
jgi:hypothetical protein